jgi:ribose transport system ATP-binding protein
VPPPPLVPRLAVRDLRKAFGGNPVLRGLELTLAPGEVHALAGGNGAGKSTFAKIVAGIERRDHGEILFDGQPFAPADRRAAQRAGVVMVLQELNLLPTLTVAENLFIDHLPTRWGGIVHQPRLQAAAQAALARVGLGAMDPRTPAGTLGIAQQQLVEIAAALAKDCRLLILDEPTATLAEAEVQAFFKLLRELKAAGTSILYISHRLEEFRALADRVSVLRDGQMVATFPASEVERERLIALMAGPPVQTATAILTGPTNAADPMVGTGGPPVRSNQDQKRAWTGDLPSEALAHEGPPIPTFPALDVRNLSRGSHARGVSLQVARGEIVGLGGLVGAGRTELLRLIYGADRADGGDVRLGAGPPYRPRSPADSAKRGLAFVPEDRKQQGILAPLAVRINASLTRLPTRRLCPGWIDQRVERTEVPALLDRLAVRYADLEQPISQLSGGNQQKVVLGRWLWGEATILLLDEPTRGVDAAARQSIYATLRELAATGKAVLVASSDYEELTTLCDRILVLSRGRLTGEFTPATIAPPSFLAAALAEFDAPASASN